MPSCNGENSIPQKKIMGFKLTLANSHQNSSIPNAFMLSPLGVNWVVIFDVRTISTQPASSSHLQPQQSLGQRPPTGKEISRKILKLG
jgi:hypothetical protein